MSDLEQPLLSVIVPIYNAEKYVTKCVQSILEQDYPRVEIILVNDGSTDKSGELADGFAEKHGNVKVIHQKNRGVSAARNVGIEVSSGEYVTFVDADDYLNRETYGVILGELIKNHCDAAIYPFSREYRAYSQVARLPWPDKTVLNRENIRGELIPAMIAVHRKEKVISGSVSRTVFHRRVARKIRFNERVQIQEDLIYCIQAYSCMHSIEIISEVCYHYVKHDETTTEHYRKNFLHESVAFEEEIVKALEEAGLFEGLSERYWAKRITMYSLCLSNLFRYDAPGDINSELREVIDCFCGDKFIRRRFYPAFLERRMLVPYLLLRLKSSVLIKLVYGSKERIRQRKLRE